MKEEPIDPIIVFKNALTTINAILDTKPQLLETIQAENTRPNWERRRSKATLLLIDSVIERTNEDNFPRGVETDHLLGIIIEKFLAKYERRATHMSIYKKVCDQIKEKQFQNINRIDTEEIREAINLRDSARPVKFTKVMKKLNIGMNKSPEPEPLDSFISKLFELLLRVLDEVPTKVYHQEKCNEETSTTFENGQKMKFLVDHFIFKSTPAPSTGASTTPAATLAEDQTLPFTNFRQTEVGNPFLAVVPTDSPSWATSSKSAVVCAVPETSSIFPSLNTRQNLQRTQFTTSFAAPVSMVSHIKDEFPTYGFERGVDGHQQSKERSTGSLKRKAMTAEKEPLVSGIKIEEPTENPHNAVSTISAAPVNIISQIKEEFPFAEYQEAVNADTEPLVSRIKVEEPTENPHNAVSTISAAPVNIISQIKEEFPFAKYQEAVNADTEPLNPHNTVSTSSAAPVTLISQIKEELPFADFEEPSAGNQKSKERSSQSLKRETTAADKEPLPSRIKVEEPTGNPHNTMSTSSATPVTLISEIKEEIPFPDFEEPSAGNQKSKKERSTGSSKRKRTTADEEPSSSRIKIEETTEMTLNPHVTVSTSSAAPVDIISEIKEEVPFPDFEEPSAQRSKKRSTGCLNPTAEENPSVSPATDFNNSQVNQGNEHNDEQNDHTNYTYDYVFDEFGFDIEYQ